MPQTFDIHINPSDQTIAVGHLTIRFLLTGEDSGGSIAAFELTVPGSRRLPAPAHSHDRYEETIYGIEGSLTWTVVRHAAAAHNNCHQSPLLIEALRLR
jgi:quercetin dioxygenase-like cupin family protein